MLQFTPSAVSFWHVSPAKVNIKIHDFLSRGGIIIANPETGTRKESIGDKFYALRQLLLAVLGFLILLDLTMIFSFSPNLYLIGFIVTYIVLLPFLAMFRHVYTFFIILPVPYLGSWLMSIMYLSSFAIPLFQAIVLVSILPTVLATSIHLFSRNRSMIGKVPMTSLSRASIAAGSATFFIVTIMIIGPESVELPAHSKAILYSVLLFAYISSSMLYVNSTYRYRVICQMFNANRIERNLSKIWGRIGNKFPNQQKDLDLLRYYLEEALHFFVEGHYELAFASGYKVINEKTVVNPKDYVSDQRKGKPSFSEVRTVLMHSVGKRHRSM